MIDLTFDLLLRLSAGPQELLELRVTGIDDDDGDFDPELTVSVEVLGREMIPEESSTIEVEASALFRALSQGAGAVRGVLVDAGVPFPGDS